MLDKGQLWEYTNWKRSSELHNDSIHLNAATVREAQNSERRFCFELVTPVNIHHIGTNWAEIQTSLSSDFKRGHAILDSGNTSAISPRICATRVPMISLAVTPAALRRS